MEKSDALISLLTEERMLDEQALEALIEKHEETGQSLIAILKEGNLLDEEQFTRIVARASGIEFVNLSPGEVDPMVAHLVSYEMASQHTLDLPLAKRAYSRGSCRSIFGRTIQRAFSARQSGAVRAAIPNRAPSTSFGPISI